MHPEIDATGRNRIRIEFHVQKAVSRIRPESMDKEGVYRVLFPRAGRGGTLYDSGKNSSVSVSEIVAALCEIDLAPISPEPPPYSPKIGAGNSAQRYDLEGVPFRFFLAAEAAWDAGRRTRGMQEARDARPTVAGHGERHATRGVFHQYKPRPGY